MKGLKRSLLLLYLAILAYIVFFVARRQTLAWDDGLLNLVPVQHTLTWYHALAQQAPKHREEFFYNLFGNILLFIPLPVLLLESTKVSSSAFVIVLGIGISILIELCQYFWRIGVPDIDDVLLNTGGVLIGVLFWKSFGKKR